MAVALIAVENGIIPLQWETFCAELAIGTPASKAAINAGYTAAYATDLVDRPEIKARVQELVEARRTDGGVVPRIWAELVLVQIVRDSLNGTEDVIAEDGTISAKGIKRNRSEARAALMDLARLRGWIVERKQVDTRSVTARLGSKDLSATLDAMQSALSPQARKRLDAITSKSKVVDAEPPGE